MNTVQRNYIKAKAFKDVVEKAIADLEKSLLKKYGRKEKGVFDINDKKVFNQIYEELVNAEAEYGSVYDDFYLAEQELIKWALANVPQVQNLPQVRFDDKSKVFSPWEYKARFISLALQIKA